MAVGLKSPGVLYPVRGVRLGIARAGIRKPDRRDLTIFSLDKGSQFAAVFTRNAFCAAPVQIARAHLSKMMPQALVVNTGNANAGTGSRGLADAQRTCRELADLMGLAVEQVLPFSTGVIGEYLPMDRLLAGLPVALSAIKEDNWLEAAQAIMTTDTLPKAVSRRFALGDRQITVTGISKGAGMIRPDMATMLAYIATDAPVAQDDLQALLCRVAELSFNCITIDGDTSTNDAACLIATGQAGGSMISPSCAEWPAFERHLTAVCVELAQAIVRDGEGATKFITLDIQGAAEPGEARRVADAIAHSPLVKTAFNASDPNWGRILAAVGRAGVPNLALEKVEIALNDVLVVKQGGVAPTYTEAAGQAVMAEAEITVTVRLGRGAVATKVWTCDLSHDYVTINAEYRT